MHLGQQFQLVVGVCGRDRLCPFVKPDVSGNDRPPERPGHHLGDFLAVMPSVGAELERRIGEAVFGQCNCRNFGNITVIDTGDTRRRRERLGEGAGCKHTWPGRAEVLHEVRGMQNGVIER